MCDIDNTIKCNHSGVYDFLEQKCVLCNYEFDSHDMIFTLGCDGIRVWMNIFFKEGQRYFTTLTYNYDDYKDGRIVSCILRMNNHIMDAYDRLRRGNLLY